MHYFFLIVLHRHCLPKKDPEFPCSLQLWRVERRSRDVGGMCISGLLEHIVIVEDICCAAQSVEEIFHNNLPCVVQGQFLSKSARYPISI